MSERGVTSGCRTEEDMISFLPDHLLCQILSHVPTKTGVMTSVLSTRWRTVWLSTPLLDLHTDDFPSFTALASFISRFLDGSSCLQKLKLALVSGRPIEDISNDFLRFSFNDKRIIQDISNHPAYLMTQWINNAVTRKVQHVDILYHWIVDMMMMPLSIYTCETLVSLKLHNVTLTDSEYVSLPRLKIMHLVDNVCANDAFIGKLISSCPVLEELTVVRNRDTKYDFEVLRVRSQSLKSLVVVLIGREWWYNACRVVVIDAPGLNYLSLKDNKFTSYVITNLSSSAKVDIDVSFDVDIDLATDRSVVRSFLTMLSSVRNMTISRTTLEVEMYLHYVCVNGFELSILNEKFFFLMCLQSICLYLKHEPMPQFPYLIRLDAVLYNSDLGNLPNILQICPNLKSLVLVMKLYLLYYIWFYSHL